jgi:hypothetical protein
MTSLSSVRTDVSAVAVPADEAGSSVAWSAIIAGALAAAAMSLILFVLGSGLGLTLVSPWSSAGMNGAAFAITTAIWLVVTQWLSAGVGGYLAGRLRAR